MQISDHDMAHLKTLARLELSDAETQRLKDDLNSILGYFEQLTELNTEAVEPLARPIELYSIYRDDVPGAPLSQAAALALATEQEDGFFKVPRTVDSDL
jgi:aspartyl-tRNA(Asn)/glutamyl-tRNA(Gln) amidotransferase subunit C